MKYWTTTFFALLACLSLATGTLACGDVDRPTDGDGDHSNIGDADGDGEGDADGDSHGDGEGDADGDTDGDGEGDADGDTDGDAEGDADEIEVAGTWDASSGGVGVGEETIDDEMWDFMHLIDFDNDERWAITQNPDDDEWNPDAYNRLVWTPIDDDVFHYCTVDFGLDTEQEARDSTATADDDDLDDEGCAGFPWTRMTRQ